MAIASLVDTPKLSLPIKPGLKETMLCVASNILATKVYLVSWKNSNLPLHFFTLENASAVSVLMS